MAVIVINPYQYAAPIGPEPDSSFEKVSLLLYGNGPNNSTTFTDSSLHNHTVTANGNAQISTAQSKFGGASMYFYGGYIRATDSSEFAFGTEDFTVEAWLRGTGPFLDTRTSLYNAGFGYNIQSSTNNITMWDGQGNSFVYTGSNTYDWTDWHHVAISRSGTTLRVFVDGSLDGTATTSRNLTAQGGIVGANINKVLNGGGAKVFSGYIDDFRITKGVARYTSNFTPPTKSLTAHWEPYFDDVSLMLHGDDLTDSSVHDHALSNNSISVSTATKKYGTGSLYFSTSAYGTFSHDTSFDIGTGDYTIEAWVYPQNSGTRGIAHNHPSLYGGGFTFWIGNDSKLRIQNFTNGNSSATTIIATTTTPNGTWAHVAYSRSGGTGYLFVNGNLEGTHTDSRNLTNNSGFYVGAAEGALYRGIGYIDDLRFTVGLGRYASDFTPPQRALPEQFGTPDEAGTDCDVYADDVSLLLRGDGTNGSNTFTDSSNNSHAVTANSNAQISTAQSKFGGASMYFNGNGDYLLLPNDLNSFDFGTGDFTIECWVYWQGGGGNLFSQRHAYNTSNTGMTFRTEVSSNFSFFYGNGSGFFQTSSGSLTQNTWTHVAVTRNGNTFTIWVNGQSDATNTISAAMIYYPPVIGRVQGASYEYFNGYLDDFRVTKGVARYTSDFIPPTIPLAL